MSSLVCMENVSDILAVGFYDAIYRTYGYSVLEFMIDVDALCIIFRCILMIFFFLLYSRFLRKKDFIR